MGGGWLINSSLRYIYRLCFPEFRGLTNDNFRYNGTVEILGVECEDWIYEGNSQGNFSAVKDKLKPKACALVRQFGTKSSLG